VLNRAIVGVMILGGIAAGVRFSPAAAGGGGAGEKPDAKATAGGGVIEPGAKVEKLAGGFAFT
jgi:hypothetical protein